jgi:hypothetical protein
LVKVGFSDYHTSPLTARSGRREEGGMKEREREKLFGKNVAGDRITVRFLGY